MQNLPKPRLFDLSANSLAQLKQRAESSQAKSQDKLNYANALFQFGDVERATDFLSLHLHDDRCMSRLREYYIGERMNTHALTLVQRFEREKGISSKIDEAIRTHLAGDHKKALELAREAITINPEHAEAYNHAARALFNLQLIQEAYIHFGKSLRIDPNSPEVWHNMAHLLRAGGHFNDAENAYNNALSLAPNYVSALVNLAVVKLGYNQAHDALPLLNKALKLNPSHAEAHLNAGICQQFLENFPHSKMHFQQSIRIDPHNPFAFSHLGSLHRQLGEIDQAINHFQESIRLNPHNIEAWVDLISSLQATQANEQAQQALQEAKRLFPKDSNLDFLHGQLQISQGDLHEGLAILRKIDPNRLYPKNAYEFFFELGKAHDKNDESELAYKAFYQAKQLVAAGSRVKKINKDVLPNQINAVNSWLDSAAKTGFVNEQGDQGADLCFLIGFPGSDSKLIDTALSAQAHVRLINEINSIENVAYQLSDHPEGFPNAMKQIKVSDIETLRTLYRNLITDNKKNSSKNILVVDKMLFRSHMTAFIHRLFPKAEFIFSLRHPCDAILESFMQRYPLNEGTIHFSTLQSSVAIYDQIMSCWRKTHQVIKPKFQYVRYEEMIDNPSRAISGLYDFLGFTHKESISGYQARYEQSSRWVAYKQYFEPYRAVLQPHLDYFGYQWDE